MRAAVFDTETTGLLKHPRAKDEAQPRCIEFGAVVVDEHGVQHDELELLIDPGERLDPVITKITGITDSDLKGKPRFAEVADRIEQLLTSCDAVVAHNLPFDYGVMEREFHLLGRELRWPDIQLCTVQENVPVYGYRVKLKDLYRDVTGETWHQGHRALDDCKRLAEVVVTEGYLEVLA